MKTCVIGDNYLAKSFENIFDIIPTYSDYSSIEKYDVIINCVDVRDGNLRQLFYPNYGSVKDIHDWCNIDNKKLIHVSTAELYGRNHDYEQTTEDSLWLDMNSDYRISKRIAERLIDTDKHVILRVKNLFDSTIHDDNWLIKMYKSSTLSDYIDSITYIPNLHRIIFKIINDELVGIFNATEYESKSPHHYFTEILQIDKKIRLGNSGDDDLYCDVNTTKIHTLLPDLMIDSTGYVAAAWAMIDKINLDNFVKSDIVDLP